MKRFTKEFKEKALTLKKQGIHPNDIFTQQGIEIQDKQKDYASKTIAHWRSTLVQNTVHSHERKVHIQREEKRIEYLEAKVAYLEAEKAFLAKLPRKKRN